MNAPDFRPDWHLSACLAALDEAQQSPIDLLGSDAEDWFERLVCVYLADRPREEREKTLMRVMDQMAIAAAARIDVRKVAP